MAWRITESEVRAIIDTDSNLSVAPFIDMANALVDKIEDNDSEAIMNATLLKLVEKSLAAHFYSRRDPQYTSKPTGGASGSFQGQTGYGFDSTLWGQDAKRMDLTGFLTKLDMPGSRKAKMSWLGKPKSEQTDYQDRD